MEAEQRMVQHIVHHMVCRMVSPMSTQEVYSKQYTRQYIKHLPDPEQHMEKTKSHTVPVQFQYGAHSTRDGNSFQNHHTLHTSSNDSDSAAGKLSTCKYTGNAKYFMEWTSSTLCTCPQATKTVIKPGDSLALREVQYLHNGRTSVNRLPLMKQDILSRYSSCFEGIGCFPGESYKFHLKPEHKPARHASRKVPIHLEDAFKEEIKSLVKLGILEEVKNTLTGSIHM